MAVTTAPAAGAVVLGVDSSTQSTKVEAWDVARGTVLATGRAPHPATTPPVSEQDPAAWWDALVAAVGQLGELRRRVTAISVAAQQHGLVLLDEAGAVLRPAKLWNDTTSAPQATRLVAQLGAQRWADACGSVPVASFTITKLAWVAEHEPALLARVGQVLLPHDYLTWRLTGRAVTDRGDASGTGWFDPRTDRYCEPLLEAAGAAHLLDRLPLLHRADEPVGLLAADAAAALGLPGGVLVGAGTGDNMGAAVGLGLRPGAVVLSLGTSGVVYAVSNRPTADPSGLVAGFASADGSYLPLACTLNAMRVTDTVAGWLGVDPVGLSALALEAADRAANGTAGRDTEGPVLVPFFDGERTPSLPDATGVLTGLRTSTTRDQLALAAVDGVVCSQLFGLDALRAAGVAADGQLHLIGGGARSAAFRRRVATLYGEAIVVPAIDETVAAGAAVLAAILVTGERTHELAVRWSLGAGPTVEPDAGEVAAASAQRVRERYRTAVHQL